MGLEYQSDKAPITGCSPQTYLIPFIIKLHEKFHKNHLTSRILEYFLFPRAEILQNQHFFNDISVLPLLAENRKSKKYT